MLRQIFTIIFMAGIFNFAHATDVRQNDTAPVQTPPPSLEQITITDIIQDETVSPEFKSRIQDFMDRSQFEIDSYRASLENHHKQFDQKMLEIQKELNSLHDASDSIQMNSGIYKWMIISLSIGIGCLMLVMVIMWRSVVNVNRNEVAVLYAIENLKKDIAALEKKLDQNAKL